MLNNNISSHCLFQLQLTDFMILVQSNMCFTTNKTVKMEVPEQSNFYNLTVAMSREFQSRQPSEKEETILLVWGHTNFGQPGYQRYGTITEPREIVLPLTIRKVCCGISHTLLLTQNGNVYAAGSNEFGKLGINSSSAVNTPVRLKGVNKYRVVCDISIKDIAVGTNHNVCLGLDGLLYSWGDNQFVEYCNQLEGQCGHQHAAQINEPQKVQTITHNINEFVLFTEIECGANHSAALTSTTVTQSVYLFGSSSKGQLGLGGAIKMIDIPVRLPTETKIKQVTCKDDLTVFLTAEGEVFTAGESEFRSCDIPTEVLCIFYRQLKLPGGLVIKAVYASSVIFLVSLKNELHYLDEFGEVRFIDHPAELKELVVGPYGLFARSRSGEHFEFLKDDEFDANPCFEKVAIENVSHVYAGPDYRIAVKAQNHSLKERLVQKIGNSKVQKQRNRTPLIQKPKNSDSRNTLMQDSQSTIDLNQQESTNHSIASSTGQNARFIKRTHSDIKQAPDSRSSKQDKENFLFLQQRNSELENQLKRQQAILLEYHQRLTSLQQHSKVCPLAAMNDEPDYQEFTFTCNSKPQWD